MAPSDPVTDESPDLSRDATGPEVMSEEDAKLLEKATGSGKKSGAGNSSARSNRRRSNSSGEARKLRKEMDELRKVLTAQLDDKQAEIEELRELLEANTGPETSDGDPARIEELSSELQRTREELDARTRELEEARNAEEDARQLAEEAIEQRDQKNNIVAALTQRLEQAAEQLDRMNRTGGRPAAGGGGMSGDLVSEQRDLMQELNLAVARWSDLDVGTSLSRIEIQMGELRDLLIDRFQHPQGGHSPSAPVTDESAASPKSVSTDAAVTPAEGMSAWEAMKANILGDDPHYDGEAIPESGTIESGGDTETEGETEDEGLPVMTIAEPFANLDDLAIPEPVDPETLSDEEWLVAFEARDECIASLMKTLRQNGSIRYRSPDWTALSETPTELRSAVEALRDRIQEILRVAEVELSLERARLGREKIRLEHLQQSANEDATIPEEKRGTKWRRMLGIDDA